MPAKLSRLPSKYVSMPPSVAKAADPRTDIDAATADRCFRRFKISFLALSSFCYEIEHMVASHVEL